MLTWQEFLESRVGVKTSLTYERGGVTYGKKCKNCGKSTHPDHPTYERDRPSGIKCEKCRTKKPAYKPIATTGGRAGAAGGEGGRVVRSSGAFS